MPNGEIWLVKENQAVKGVSGDPGRPRKSHVDTEPRVYSQSETREEYEPGVDDHQRRKARNILLSRAEESQGSGTAVARIREGNLMPVEIRTRCAARKCRAFLDKKSKLDWIGTVRWKPHVNFLGQKI